MNFSERLKKACDHSGIGWSQTAIGRALGVSKQTAERWMGDGKPSADTLFAVADKLKVDARWLATGEGEMLRKPAAASELEPHEDDLIARYRIADPRWQLSLRLLSYVATEEQHEVAGDVNIVLARIFGKRPKDIRPVPNKAVERAYGMAPHVAARKRERERK